MEEHMQANKISGRSGRYMIVALSLLAFVIQAPGLFAQSMVTPMVVVKDQAIENSNIVVENVTSEKAGWIVIHADNNGKPGPVIGYAAVREGDNPSVAVEIDASKATPVLYAMLHVDAGTIGVYEFPGADVPVKVDGMMVSPAFNASSKMAAY
jgi:hypothetical protein